MSELDVECWIQARLGASVLEESVEEFKEVLVTYQEVLSDWVIQVEDDERITTDAKLYKRVSLIPKDSGVVSPRYLHDNQQDILECANKLCEELGSRGRTQIFHDPFSGIEQVSTTSLGLEGYWCLAFRARGVPYTNILTYTFLSKKRVSFDRAFPELAKELFSETVDHLVANYRLYASWWQRIWYGEEYVQALARSRKRLREWYGINYDTLVS